MGFSAFAGGGNITSLATKTTNLFCSSIGCPTLGSLGISIPNIIKMFHSTSEKITTDIKDISLQTNTYNKVIPEVFGKVRIAGNIFWQSDITKTSVYHPQKTTKNGTQSAYTEYFLRSSFAIAICKGEVDEIKNIYADNEPISASNYNIQIYLGNAEQKSDPTMQSYLGADIPAFRDLCYVVFNDFPMEEFGNRIPNFTFDVIRNKNFIEENSMENLVKSIHIIPGSGEFVYDTITQRKKNGYYINGVFYETSKATILNNHTTSENTNAVDSLNDLLNTFPNIEYVSLVVSWFCDNLNSDVANVYPACESRSINTLPDEWIVAGKNRLTANLVGLDIEGNIRYGGTPSDICVKRYAQEIKRRGLKLCIYPMMMVDVDDKPWRGHMQGSPDKIHNFFIKDNGYNQFIKHYVNLLKDEIDVIIIGSEMKELTSVYDETNNCYPAVDEFCNLADEIRQIVNVNTKITYASDWSEYHHDGRGNYNMDKLWANENIDFIGIDAYFPLTDKSSTSYDIEEIKNGWKSGEGYDYYYEDNERTIKKSLSEEYAWKNVEWFYNNYHYNSDGAITEWKPKMKKIWFTEYGFPSVDCCSNQPNVFYSKGSYDSAFPRNSKGNVDFKAQRLAITASELAWQNSECVERMFLYTWDARPYPVFPNLSSVWADTDCWKYGHFLNGKTGFSKLSMIISYLCRKAGLGEDEFDTTLLSDDIIEGYVLDNKYTILQHIKILSTAFSFDSYIENGKIYFKSLKNTNTYEIDENDILIENIEKYNDIISHNNENQVFNKPSFFVKNNSNFSIPSCVEVLFLDVEKNYTTSTARAKDNTNKNSSSSYSISVSIPMNLSQAQEIAWKILDNFINQNNSLLLKLPISYIYISPLDTIKLKINNENFIFRVNGISIVDKNYLILTGYSIIENEDILKNLEYNILTGDNYSNDLNITTNYISKTNFELYELGNIKNDVATDTFSIHCAIWSDDENWDGASIYYSTDNENNYNFLSSVRTETTIGQLLSMDSVFLNTNNIQNNLNVNNYVLPVFLDVNTEIIVSIPDENNKLVSITDEKFSKLENIILIGEEIIAFRDVEQIDKNKFKLSYLLRGRFNTENSINNHQIGERVIILDNDFFTIDLPITQKNNDIYIKVISTNESLLNVDAKKITPKAKSIMDYEPRNLDITTMINKDIKISYSPRKAYKVADMSNVELPNKNIISIYDKNDNKVRTIKLQEAKSMFYTTSMQKNDFGCIVNQNEIYFKVDNIIKVYSR